MDDFMATVPKLLGDDLSRLSTDASARWP
jgi:hypothetical protein